MLISGGINWFYALPLDNGHKASGVNDNLTKVALVPLFLLLGPE